jgi:hypothetical protein
LKHRPFLPNHLPFEFTGFRGLAGWGLVLAVLLFAVPGVGAESVSAMVARLSGAADFRVRAQAALALGASGSERAVEPLCNALEDSSTTVRASAAAALGRLARGGEDCLRARLDEESSASVKSVLEKALGQLKGGPALSGVSAKTQYYVALGETTDKSGRKDESVDRLVRAAVSAAVESAGEGFALAPPKETAGDAAKVFKEHKQLAGFFLWPKISPPEYSGGSLTVRLEVSIFTYPSRSLKAVVPMKLTMPGVDGVDRESENELIQMAAEKSFEKFTASVARLR